MWVNRGMVNQMDKLGLQVSDLLMDIETLVKKWVDEHSQAELHIEEELKMLTDAFSMLEEKAKAIDPTLSKAVAADKVKQIKHFEQLGGRLMRAEKHKFEQTTNKIRKVREKLFPNGGLQERYDNFMTFYLQYGTSFLTYLIENLNPLNKEFLVILDKE